MAGKPVNITIGATVASSLGAAVRDAKNQLGTLGAKVSSLNNKKVKVDQLVAMKAQTNDLGRAYGHMGRPESAPMNSVLRMRRWGRPLLHRHGKCVRLNRLRKRLVRH